MQVLVVKLRSRKRYGVQPCVQEEGRNIEGGQTAVAVGAGEEKMQLMLCFKSRVMLKMPKIEQGCKMRWEMRIALQ